MTPEIAAEIARLRAALSFYQDPWGPAQEQDRGKFARETLSAHLMRALEYPCAPPVSLS